MPKKLIDTDYQGHINQLYNYLEEGFLLCEILFANNDITDYKILESNNAFLSLFGLQGENIIGSTIKKILPEIHNKLIEVSVQDVKKGEEIKSVFNIGRKHYKIKAICPEEGFVFILVNDITEKFRADEILKKHFMLFENAQDIILYLKEDGAIIDANKTAVSKYGYNYSELLNMKLHQLRHPSTLKEFEQQMQISALKGIVFECIHVRKDGTSFPVEVSSRSVEIKGELLRIHIIRDITDRKQKEEKIKYLASYDALTGIPNRGFLMLQYEKILEQARRGAFKIAVMLFDVDKFKAINDIHGHNAGDEVLRKVGRRLQEAVRNSDIIGRLGGDEFLVVQILQNGIEDSHKLAQRILEEVTKPVEWDNRVLNIRLSIGISIYPKDSGSPEGLIQCADKAMYAIKQKGGNSYNFYNS